MGSHHGPPDWIVQTENTVLEALRLGYRLLDGASFYNNEASLGRALARSPVPREELYSDVLT